MRRTVTESVPVIRAGWAGAVRTAVTTRVGGVSEGPYASLNLGDHVDDDPAAVAENRRRLHEALSLHRDPCWLAQVHGTRILDLDAGETGPADAAVTRAPGTVLAVLTADCLPVLLAAEDDSVIAVAHAGWRGLLDGVIPAAVAATGVTPGRLRAFLGPAISAARYEVGPEVAERAAAAGFDDPRFIPTPHGGRAHLDLVAIARAQLEHTGVGQVSGGDLCTASDPDRFFSYRRDGVCGRMASLLWIEPEG